MPQMFTFSDKLTLSDIAPKVQRRANNLKEQYREGGREKRDLEKHLQNLSILKKTIRQKCEYSHNQ